MKKPITLLVLILLAVTIGCGEKDASNEDFITIDVTKSYPKKELILQDFLDVEYIPLETTDEFLTMAHIEAIGKEVIIVRNRNRATDGKIFIYDRSGKGLRIIKRLGQGAEEYTFLLGITLDEDNEEIFVNDHYSKKVFVYDLLGNFKRNFGYKEDVFYLPIHNFDKDHLIYLDAHSNFDEIIRSRFLIISKQDGSVTKEIQIPYKEKKTPIILVTDANGYIRNDASPRNQELTPYRDSWLLVEPSSDTIYRSQPDYSMTPFIARTPSIQSMATEVFLFPGVLTDRYCFMQTVKKEFDFMTRTGFPRVDLVYDRQEKALFECAVYNDDFTKKSPMSLVYEITVINNDEIAFIKKLEAPDLIDAYEKGLLKGKLKEIAATLNEESNPVIMLAKYKK